MKINPEINTVLKTFNIPVNDGISYLLSIYYDVKPSYTPLSLIEKMNRTRILVLDEASKTLDWNVPLFEEQVTGFEWVKEWIEEFGRINKDRKGTYRNVAARMKTFFVNNPAIRQDEVIEATKMYLRTVTQPVYLKTSHKFIYEGQGAEKVSHLLEWVNRYKEMTASENGRESYNNTMM